MVVLRLKEIRDMSTEDMQKKLSELRQELMSERAKIASGGTPDNPGKIRELRKVVARIHTIATEKGYQLNE